MLNLNFETKDLVSTQIPHPQTAKLPFFEFRPLLFSDDVLDSTLGNDFVKGEGG